MAVSSDDQNKYKQPKPPGGGGANDMNPMPLPSGMGGSWLQGLPWLQGRPPGGGGGGTSNGGGAGGHFPMPPVFNGQLPFGAGSMHEVMKNFVHRFPNEPLPTGDGMRQALLDQIAQLIGGIQGGNSLPPAVSPMPFQGGSVPPTSVPPGTPMPFNGTDPLVQLLSILSQPRNPGTPGGPGVQI